MKDDQPNGETERLLALRRYNVLDTSPEEEFDALVRLAAHIADTPIAYISLVDADRQWFKSRYGFELTQTPREISICTHVIDSGAPLTISDLSADDRFHKNPLVTAPAGLRFYAGFPLTTPDQYAIGTLCVLDVVPRELGAVEGEMLELIARQTVDRLEQRRANLKLSTFQKFFDLTLSLLCTADSDLKFVELNPAWNATLGWSLEELRAVPFTDFVHPDDLNATEAIASQLLQGAVTVNFQNRYRHKEGGWVPLSWVSAVHDGVFYAAATDMTDYVRKADQLNALAAVVETSYDAIITITLSGEISGWNPAAERMFGYRRDEAIGQSIAILHPAHLNDGTSEKLRALRNGKTVMPFETARLHRDGSEIDVSVTLSPLFDARGEVTGTSSIVRDITEQKQLDQMKSEFVSTVSHELRTPLTSIRGSLGLVSSGVTGELPVEAKEYLDIAVSNSERLVRLVNDILDIEKMESGRVDFHFRATELGRIIEDAIAANEAFANSEHVTLSLETPVPAGEVSVDPDRLAQVLTNLLSNAAKFSPPESTVEISVEANDQSVTVYVRDRGPGIPNGFAERIFERFSQADASTTRAKGGTGLGLAISKRIIERMHGEIGFRPADGGGAVFYFTLPFFEPVTDTIINPLCGGYVLICEPDSETAHALERSLQHHGFCTHIAPTMERARRLMKRMTYDAIALNLLLADGPAADLIAEIRSNSDTAKTPIVVVSGTPDDPNEGAFRIGDVFQKPIDEERLVRALRNAIATAKGEKPRILHVEDEDDLRRIVRRTLSDDGVVTSVKTFAEGKRALSEQRFDVVILDLGLPDGDGDALIGHVGDAQVIIFSASEPSHSIGNQVAATLVKSRSDPFDVRQTVTALIASSLEN